MTNDSHLDHLRCALVEPLPHPEGAALADLSRLTVDWLLRHFATLPEQPIGWTASRGEMEALLREAPPEVGRDFDKVLAEFEQHVAAYAFRVNHPRFLAFVPGAPTFLSVLGDWLCAGTNFFAGVWLEASGPAEVEVVVLDWFKEFVGYPATADGLLTGGGSEANLTALLAARERLSFADRQRAVLYLSEQRHWSVDRAAKIIGFRPDQVCPLPVDAQLRLTPEPVGRAVAQDRAEGRLPWVVVANAGATSTGTVDPLLELSNLCRTERLWLHVDAAYGWPIVLLPEGRTIREGIAQADSVTLDPHKWFGQTFEVGCVLVREAGLLAETFHTRPDYMQDIPTHPEEVNFADHGLALTRRFRALKIWLSVKVLGVSWFRSLIRRCCELAEYAQLLLEQSARFEILCPRQLSVVCFRYLPEGFPPRSPADEERLNRINLALVRELQATGRAFLSSTLLQGRVALRFCFVNWRTTAADLEEVMLLLRQLGDRIES